MQIRNARIEDLPDIVRIYNQAIATKRATADLTPIEVEQRITWFHEHAPMKYPIIVYEIDKVVCGWISLSPYRLGREALRYTAEVSYYVDFNHHGKGIGTELLAYILKHCIEYAIKTVFAIVLEHNKASIHLLKKFNFEQWGFMPKVADFDGEEQGHYYYGLRVTDRV